MISQTVTTTTAKILVTTDKTTTFAKRTTSRGTIDEKVMQHTQEPRKTGNC